MKYSEAVKIAERDPDFKGAWDRFVKHCKEDNTEGAMIFRIEGNDGETFYRSVNNFYDERIDGYRFSISGGKHSASRARYLIQHDKAYVVRANVMVAKSFPLYGRLEYIAPEEYLTSDEWEYCGTEESFSGDTWDIVNRTTGISYDCRYTRI